MRLALEIAGLGLIGMLVTSLVFYKMGYRAGVADEQYRQRVRIDIPKHVPYQGEFDDRPKTHRKVYYGAAAEEPRAVHRSVRLEPSAGQGESPPASGWTDLPLHHGED